MIYMQSAAAELKREEKIEYRDAFAEDVLVGLSQTPKQLPSKYFYDDCGSKIFQQITAHHDYYPTDCEFDILEHARHILPTIISDQKIDVVELGAGDGHKTQLVLDGFLSANRLVNYFPIDISAKAMQLLGEKIPSHPYLTQHNIVADYFTGLKSIKQSSKNRKLLLFLGSNIGNFNHIESRQFLTRLQHCLNTNDYLLIGFDLKKDINVLNKAYNDSSGLTRAFNLNLLHRINRELGANFDIDLFDHYGLYNPAIGAMESYLISKTQQDVNIKKLEATISFSAFEAIHVEYSFKYLPQDIEKLGKQCGYRVFSHFPDDRRYFIDSLWQVTAFKK